MYLDAGRGYSYKYTQSRIFKLVDVSEAILWLFLVRSARSGGDSFLFLFLCEQQAWLWGAWILISRSTWLLLQQRLCSPLKLLREGCLQSWSFWSILASLFLLPGAFEWGVRFLVSSTSASSYAHADLFNWVNTHGLSRSSWYSSPWEICAWGSVVARIISLTECWAA